MPLDFFSLTQESSLLDSNSCTSEILSHFTGNVPIKQKQWRGANVSQPLNQTLNHTHKGSNQAKPKENKLPRSYQKHLSQVPPVPEDI